MAMTLDFEPHSWYMNFAIKENGNDDCEYKLDGTDTDGTKWYQCIVHDCLAPSPDAPCADWERHSWTAYTDNGNTYHIAELQADTLDKLKSNIREYYHKTANPLEGFVEDKLFDQNL